MKSRRAFSRLILLSLAGVLILLACARAAVTPTILPTSLPTQTPLPPTLAPESIYHTTTIWNVVPNLALDALCFIPVLTGDPFYVKNYQSEYNHFAPQLTPDVQQALTEIQTVVRQHDSLLSSTLIRLFLPLSPKTLDDLSKALDNPEAIRLGAGLPADAEIWQLILKHIPNLKIIIGWMQEVGFEKDYKENFLPQILKRAEQLNQQLPAYNIVPVVEAALGKTLPSNTFTMYLAHYPLPFGIGLDANVSLFYSELPLGGIVDNSIHENLHVLDIQEKELWEALSFLQKDDYYMNNFKIHDPSGGYMVYEEFLEEDVVEALDQYLAEQFDAATNPRTRWGTEFLGMHTLSPVLYTLLKQENYSPQVETYHDFLIRMVQEGKLKAEMIESANHQFYASGN